jgi:hypothetical protein
MNEEERQGMVVKRKSRYGERDFDQAEKMRWILT